MLLCTVVRMLMSCTAWVCLHDTSMGIKVLDVNAMICAHLNRVRTVQRAL